MKAVEFKDFTFTYLQSSAPALSGISFELEEGTVVGVIGPAGAGKSTLVKALDGLVPKVELGYQTGDVITAGHNTRDHDVNQMAHYVSLVLQNPEIQIFSLRVWDDVAFGPANLGVPRAEIERRVASALTAAELESMADRNPNDLSGGEQQSLAIAGLLAMQPKVMAFDEPISMLDPIGKERVMAITRQATRETGATSLTTESGADMEALAETVDRLIVIDHGQLLLDGMPEQVLQSEVLDRIGVGRPQVTDLFLRLRARGLVFEHMPLNSEQAADQLRAQLRQAGVQRLELPPRPATPASPFGETVVEVENLHHIYGGTVHALKGVSFQIPRRQIVGIIGQNGSGKSTLARQLVGLLKPTNKDARLRVAGQNLRKLRMSKIIRLINYVFQNPDDQLFAETLRDEVAFAPRMLDLKPSEVARLTDEALQVFDLKRHESEYVHTLNEDLKTYLAITCILPLQPEVLLIDEPTTGLDTLGELKLMVSLRRLRDEQGKTIIIITHNMKTVANHCDRVLVMSRGNLILDGTPREVFPQTGKLLSADIRPPQITRLAQSLADEFGCPRDVLTVEEMDDILAHNLRPPTGA